MTIVMRPITASRASAARYSPRDRMVYAAVQLIRSRGVAGTSLRDVVAHAEAPWGSLGHYFPRGKDQLVAEALVWASEYAAVRVGRYRETTSAPTPSGLLGYLLAQWQVEFADAGFERGCPLVAATADVVAGNESMRATVAGGFDRWRQAIEDELRGMGVPAPRADSFATLILATLEGAIVLARARLDAAPLAAVARELGPVLDAALEDERS